MTNSRFATAVHVLTLLAMEGERPVTSDYVAGSVNTNAVVIRRLLGMLAAAGLVSSTTGPAGGSRLARSPRQITLRDAWEAVESGELVGAHSAEPNARCPVGRHIQDLLAPRIEAAEHALMASLAKTTIGDLIREVERAGQ